MIVFTRYRPDHIINNVQGVVAQYYHKIFSLLWHTLNEEVKKNIKHMESHTIELNDDSK